MGWGYGSDDGPNAWHKDFPVAKEGKRQSPINIIPGNATDAASVTNSAPLKWKYTLDHCLNVENTGASWKVNVDGKGSSLVGGPLAEEYELWQFHAHWGSDNAQGSEHTVNGKMYPAELHLVHWKKSKYPNPNVAAGESDGLAVLGLFLEVGAEHTEFQKVVDALGKIQYKGEKVDFSDKIDPAKFLPDKAADSKFFTYDGSLTTPPLLESVTWVVFEKPMQISEAQLKAMRALSFDSKDCQPNCMVNNYRPPCALGNRIVRRM